MENTQDRQMVQANWMDRLATSISPEWGYKRIAWRSAIRGFYDAGGMDRLNSGWTAVNASAEHMNGPQRDIIRARARDLERNSDISEAIIGPFERNVVGTGIRLQAKVLKADGTEDDDLNKNIEELWAEWCLPENCDITGSQSFWEMQQMAVRRMRVDGGIFFIKVNLKNRQFPFCLQVREVDDLDTSITNVKATGQNRIVGGIELDQYNKPVAYHFKQFSPDGFWAGKTERIPADRVIYLWRKTRPTQLREVSPMANTLPRVRDVNEFMEAVSIKERIQACLAVFITKLTPGGSLGRSQMSGASKDSPRRRMTPGMIHELQPGEDIKAVQPANQASNVRDFVGLQQRLAGAGQGLSYEAVSRDMSQVNYSSARQGLLEDQRTYAMLQQYLIEHLCRKVYVEFMKAAILAKELDIPDFFKSRRKYLRHTFITPGWSWIDPLKEVKANSEALLTGQDTLARICAERGEDWRDVMKQRAAEMNLAKELGLSLSQGGMNNEQTPDGAKGAEND